MEQRTNQITSYLIEIKELNHDKNQLNQNIVELEEKKAELTKKMHMEESSSETTSTNSEKNGDITKLIKVINI